MTTQTDMKKTIGMHFFEYTHTALLPRGWVVAGTLSLQHNQNSVSTTVSKQLTDKFTLEGTVGGSREGISDPNVKLVYQISPQVSSSFDASTSGAFNLNFSVNRGPYSYSLSAAVGKSSLKLTPSIAYKLAEDITLNANSTFKLKNSSVSQVSTSLGVTYYYTGSTHLGVFLNSIVKDSTLNTFCLVFTANVLGYNLKVPVFLGTNTQNQDTVLLSLGAVTVAHISALASLLFSRRYKTERKDKSGSVVFKKFEDEMGKVRVYL